MKLNYITKPNSKFVSILKTESMKRARTIYQCPLCLQTFSKHSFEDHVYSTHRFRVDEAFAAFYGASLHCSGCGKDLHYSRQYRGFPTVCSSCSSKSISTSSTSYRSSADAHNHVEQLELLLLEAKQREKELKAQEQLESTPLEKLPFPSRKYKAFLTRVALEIRVGAVNGDKQRLLDLATFIDSRTKEGAE